METGPATKVRGVRRSSPSALGTATGPCPPIAARGPHGVADEHKAVAEAARGEHVCAVTGQAFRASGGGRPGSGTRRSRRNPSGLNRAFRGREFIGQQLEAGPPHPLTNYSSRHQCNFRQLFLNRYRFRPALQSQRWTNIATSRCVWFSWKREWRGAPPQSILSRGELRSPLLQHAALRTAITMVYQLYAAR